PYHCWVNVKHTGVLSIDPDYDELDNVAINLADTILNGANGFRPLPSRSYLFIEHSNEVWNTGAAFPQTSFCKRRANLRWGGSNNDYNSWHAFRSVVMANDILTAFPEHTSRLKFIMAGHETDGWSGDAPLRWDGVSRLLNDAAANATIPPDADAIYYL